MAKLDYKAMSKDILSLVGGSENLANVNHCATRLRLKLNDPEKANKAELKNLMVFLESKL